MRTTRSTMCNISSLLDAGVEPEDKNSPVFLVLAERCLQHRDVESACCTVAVLTSEAARLRDPEEMFRNRDIYVVFVGWDDVVLALHETRSRA